MIERAWDYVVRDLPPEIAAVTSAGGECPVQIEGLISGGMPFYFRSRGEHVDLWVGEPNARPPVSATDAGFRWHGSLPEWHGDEDAGRLSPRDAFSALLRLVDLYLGGTADDGRG